MAFTSFKFVAFFIIVYAILLLIQFFIGSKSNFGAIRKAYLLVASYSFMIIADWRFCICLAALTLVTYISVRNMKLVRVGVLVAVIQLGIFKYFNFFEESISKLLGTTATTLNIIIPLGVSFYTFSAISYMVDVYRGKYSGKDGLLDTALYISFFPKLTSGPIVRADKFIAQITNHITRQDFETGIQIVVCGLFKKMVLADHLNIFVNDVFNAPTAFTGLTVIWATISYSLQIYFDFSGYSDIAIGLSRMMGFQFDKNFDVPYLSMNPTEFWKRWHISLSSWLQEYLYYPLGGNRKGKFRTYVNLFLTMLIGGLWHGANWTFIIWGGIHGLALIMHKLFMNWKIKVFGSKTAGNKLWKVISVILTYLFVNFSWIFFRADSVSNAWTVTQRCFYFGAGIRQPYTWTVLALVIALIEATVAIFRTRENNGKAVYEYMILDLHKVIPLAIFLTFIGITIIMAYIGDTAFIYGKF